MKVPYLKESTPEKPVPLETSKEFDKRYLNPDEECNCNITDDEIRQVEEERRKLDEKRRIEFVSRPEVQVPRLPPDNYYRDYEPLIYDKIAKEHD